jgi:hypothetical protein
MLPSIPVKCLALVPRIRETSGSNFGFETSYPGLFPVSLQENSGTLLQIRPRQLSFKPLQLIIHYQVRILCHVIRVLKMALSKTRIKELKCMKRLYAL